MQRYVKHFVTYLYVIIQLQIVTIYLEELQKNYIL